MSETNPPRRLGKSFAALFAGFVVVVVLSLASDLVMHALGYFPRLGEPLANPLLLLVATAYRSVYSVAGSYVTARLAPYRPMAHAMTGGALGLIISVVGAAATWNSGPAYGPHWYPLSLVVLALPCAWAGGRLHQILSPQHQ